MKKFISFAVCLCLLFSGSAYAFAQEAQSAESVLISTELPELPVQPSMEQIVFTGEAIVLNLQDVINLMLTTGSAIELAEINKKSDYAISKGYAESLTTLNLLASASIEAKVTKLTRDFARDNLESNYQAELNAIEKAAVELYYSTLTAQEYYKVAQEDLAAKKLTLSNVQKKYNLGAASRIDLMTAQNSVTEAESSLTDALTGYNSARMNFNIQMGYPLMQAVVFSEVLKVCNVPDVNLNQSMASALEMRNEIKGAEFAFDVQEALYTNSKYTTNTTSSTYKKGEVSYLMAKRQADQIRPLMQMDVIIKYMGLIQKKMAATAAESTVALAKEAYRIAQLTYSAGMSTFADLQDSEVRYNQAKLARISAITDLATAVYDFEYATSEGTTRVALGSGE